jgi:hypothetical protein
MSNPLAVRVACTMNPRVKRFNEGFHWFKDFVSPTRVFCKLATEKKIEAHF